MTLRRETIPWAKLCLVCYVGVSLIMARPTQGAEDFIISPGSIWKYWDQEQPPAGWNGPGYDDSTWFEGAGELGYGEGDETTPIDPGPDPTTPYTSAYFRHAFGIGEVPDFDFLQFGVLRDDGCVVYLNGQEMFRGNMPKGAITPSTYAVTNVSGSAENVYFKKLIPSRNLEVGMNVIAVEVHQSAPQAGRPSDDLSFDLSLMPTNIGVVRGPYLQSGSSTSVVVRWRSATPTDSLVKYGSSAGSLTSAVSNSDSLTEHAVLLTGLTPDTKYYYSFGSSDKQLDDPDYYFRTVAAATRPFRIWAIGDFGTADANEIAVRDAYYDFANGTPTDVWLMLGDNAYGAGTDSEYQRAVFDIYPNMLRSTLLYPTIGNHESYGPRGVQDYLDIFSLPMAGEAGGIPSGSERYYSFDYANVHFVCLDSMTSGRTSDTPMATWLEEDLAANTKEWTIAYWHHPPYTKGSHDSDRERDLVDMRENILPIIESYGVDLVLCGHSHCYERSFLLHGHYGYSQTLMPSMLIDDGDGRDGGDGPYTQRDSQGTVYVVAGSGGQLSGGQFNHPAMFVEFGRLGSVVLDVNNHRLDARFLRENGGIDDYFTLVKDATETIRIHTVAYGNGAFGFTWNSVAGCVYTIWRADRLPATGAPQWQPVGTVPALGATASWSDPTPRLLSTGFYRVSTSCR